MKKVLSILVFFCLMIFSSNASAELEYYSVSITDLREIVGNWYNVEGDLILTISSDYKLDGNEITAVGYTGDAGGAGYQIFFDEDGESKYIEVWFTGSENSEHQILLANGLNDDNFALRRTKNPQYFESIGGIYLGMDQDEVLNTYGTPSSTENFDRVMKEWIWKYTNLGLEVSVYAGIVTEIKIYGYGDRKFDRSGLSARSSKSEFENKYRTSISRRGNLNIGHGEIINVRDNEVTLGILTPGYVF